MIEIILFLLLLSISILLIKRRFEHRPDWTKKPQTSQPAQQKSDFFGAGGSLLASVLVIGIIGIVLLAGYWLVFPSPDEVYTAADLQKKCSGGCSTNGGALRLYNQGTVRIGSSDFGTIEIYFAEIAIQFL